MEKTRLIFNSKFTSPEKINEEFTKAYCYVCASGKNRNGSFISEEAIKDALPTLWNVPVVAHVYEDEEGNKHVGGHDYTLEKGDDGIYRYRSLCIPYGVVPERPDDVAFEEIEEPDGRGKQMYLKVPVVIWTARYPEITDAFLGDEKMYSQSMEIDVLECEPLEEDKNYTNIKSFSFSALTLLGDGVEPCFPEAKVIEDKFSIENGEFTESFAKLKEELSLCFGSVKGGNMENENIVEGTEKVNEVNFEAANVDAQEPCEGIKCVENCASEGAVCEDPVVEEVPEQKSFAASYNTKRDAIRSAVEEPEFVKDERGSIIQEIYSFLCDFDDEYVYVERDYYDAASCQTKKCRAKYSFNEADEKAEIVSEYEEMFVKWLTKEEKSAIDEMRSNYELLVQYKEAKEEESRIAKYDEALEEFADLSGNEEFDSVKENKLSYSSIEDLKNACYLIRGKYSLFSNQKKTNVVISVPIGCAHTETKTLRDKLHEEYGNRK